MPGTDQGTPGPFDVEPDELLDRRVLAGLRLDACLSRELPGRWRQMGRLAERPPLAGRRIAADAVLRDPRARVDDTWRLLERFLQRGVKPVTPSRYQSDVHRRIRV